MHWEFEPAAEMGLVLLPEDKRGEARGEEETRAWKKTTEGGGEEEEERGGETQTQGGREAEEVVWEGSQNKGNTFNSSSFDSIYNTKKHKSNVQHFAFGVFLLQLLKKSDMDDDVDSDRLKDKGDVAETDRSKWEKPVGQMKSVESKERLGGWWNAGLYLNTLCC